MCSEKEKIKKASIEWKKSSITLNDNEEEVKIKNFLSPHLPVGVISLPLSYNIASRRNPTLFDSLDEGQTNEIASIDKAHYVDRKDKPVYLTSLQMRLIYALSHYVTQFIDDKDIMGLIGYLNKTIQERKDMKGFHIEISRTLSISYLSKIIFNNQKANKKEEILKELKNLADIKQLLCLKVKTGEKDTDGKDIYKTYNVFRSLLKNVDYSNIGEEPDLVDITFSSLFFDEVKKKFALVKPNLFSIWGRKTIAKNPLFGILLSDLNNKYYQFYSAALKVKEAILAKHRYKVTEVIEEEIAKEQEKALIYKQLTATIRERTSRDYEKYRKTRNEFIPHLKTAIEALVEYGIITNKSYIAETKDIVYFYFNLDFKDNPEPQPLIDKKEDKKEDEKEP